MFSLPIKSFRLGRIEDIIKVRNHKYMKEKILSIIDNYTPEVNNATVSKTDWHNYGSHDWFDICFSKEDKETIAKYFVSRFQNSCSIDRQWFQQYEPQSGSTHLFHTHGNTGFAMIYFVELKDKRVRTIFKHPKTGKIFSPKVKEGDILIFPAHIEHSSPPNFTDTRKTIVSFNINLDNDAV